MSETEKPREATPPSDRQALQQELASLQERVSLLEQQLSAEGESAAGTWRDESYSAYYATTGFMLGMIAAAVSLLFNVVGSVMFPQLQGEQAHPLRLIQVYLTFPLGERALSIDSGLTLAIGCCLYLATGMAYGVLFNLVLHRFAARASLGRRLLISSGLGLLIWLVNFYGILSWLQPLLFHGENWIVRLVPWWVAGLTHLVFAWMMAVVYPWGTWTPYRVSKEQ